MNDTVNPVRARVERDLAGPDMADGIVHDKWAVVTNDWPFFVFSITAGDGRKFTIRVALDGYPSSAPAGIPWDDVNECPATFEQLPTGARADRIFRSEWSKQNALTPYMATERVILTGGHPEWANAFPSRSWNASRTIAFYLEQLHQELRTCSIPGSVK